MAGYVDTNLSWSGGFDRESYLVFAGQGAKESAVRAKIEADGGEVVFCREKAGRVDPAALCAAALGRGLPSVMLEGGPILADSFLRAGLVDRWVRYLAPVVLGDGVGWPAGGGSAHAIPSFSLTRHVRLGNDLQVIHDRRDFAAVLARVTV